MSNDTEALVMAISYKLDYRGPGALIMLSHRARRWVTASILPCEYTGAGPFGYRERRQTNSSARIRNCIARSVSERSTMGGTFRSDPNTYSILTQSKE